MFNNVHFMFYRHGQLTSEAKDQKTYVPREGELIQTSNDKDEEILYEVTQVKYQLQPLLRMTAEVRADAIETP